MRLWLALLAFLFIPLSVDASPVSVGKLQNAATLTISSGGAWQKLFAANQNRSALMIENYCSATTQGIMTAESLFVAFGAQPSTTAGAFEVTSCAYLNMESNYVSQQAVWVYAATTAHAFQASQTQ